MFTWLYHLPSVTVIVLMGGGHYRDVVSGEALITYISCVTISRGKTRERRERKEKMKREATKRGLKIPWPSLGLCLFRWDNYSYNHCMASRKGEQLKCSTCLKRCGEGSCVHTAKICCWNESKQR